MSGQTNERTSRPRLGVVVPMANEEDTVAEFLARVLAQLEDRDSVFVVLDNASHDRTRAIVADAAAADSRVVLVWAPENTCVVDAYFRGYREALAAGCEWILEMDGGLSHCPEEIPRFLAAMASGADFAAGSRFAKGGSYKGRIARRLLSSGGTRLSNLVLGTRMRDMTSGFECFTREAMSHVVEHGVESRGHFFQTEIRYMLRDWNWVEVPISYRNPSTRVGSAGVKNALRQLWRLRRRGVRR